MADLTGARGELIELFIETIRSLPDHEWIDPASYAGWAIGGEPLRFSPAGEGIPTLGTVGAENFISGRSADQPKYLGLLRTRLLELIGDGVREDFLIESLLKEIDREIENLVDFQSINAKRDERRQVLQAQIDEPTAFRDAMAIKDPTVNHMSDTEIVEQLRPLLQHVQPVQPEQRRLASREERTGQPACKNTCTTWYSKRRGDSLLADSRLCQLSAGRNFTVARAG